MSRFKLGEFEFISLSRCIAGPSQKLARSVRPGVNGVEFHKLGKRVEPYALLSVVDTTDCDAAEDLLHQYEAIVGGNPVAAVWAGKNLSPRLVMVLDVVDLDFGAHQTLIGIGGTRGTSNGLLRCQWLINPVDPTQDLEGT